MRLVIDGRRLTAERTGVGRCLESLLEEWGTTGPPLPETLVLLQDRGGLDRVPRGSGIQAKVVGDGWPGLVWEWFGLGRELRRDDLLFATANLIPGRWRGRTVLMVFDTLPWVVPESFPWHVRLRFAGRYRRAARRAGRVIVPSRATADDVLRFHGVEAGRIRVIAPGPGPEFRPLPGDALEVRDARRFAGLGDAPFFLFVGKRSGRRNVPVLLEGFASHRLHHPRHRLVFAGPDDGGPLPGPDAGTIRAGHVPEPILRGLLAGAIALLYPSSYEGFGLPVVEAMASACPVITLRNSALTEAGGDAPLYLDAPGADDLAAAMGILATDPRERGRRQELGLFQVARFDRASYARAIKDELLAAASA